MIHWQMRAVISEVTLLQVYYFNTKTQHSSWTRPEGFTGPEGEALPVSMASIRGTEWQLVTCEDGRTYYLHGGTKVRHSLPLFQLILLSQAIKIHLPGVLHKT